jgi:hypothetical protein
VNRFVRLWTPYGIGSCTFFWAEAELLEDEEDELEDALTLTFPDEESEP